jgi:NifU-like protein involved in Fe-S cluster formation
VSAPDYSDLVVEHFERPRNSGRFDAAADVIEATTGRHSDGVQFSFTARVSGDVIVGARFRAFGCPHCIAAASWLSERLIGARQPELTQWQWREAAELLAVPMDKRGRLLILEDAVHALAENWRGKAQNAERSRFAP